MKKLGFILATSIFALVFKADAGNIPLLQLKQRIPLPNVNGRIDHLSVDVKGQRLLVAALGNNTLEVVDLAAGKAIQHLKGLHEPQGVIFIAEFNKIYVANGGNGEVDIFEGNTFKLLDRLKFSADADNLRYDPTEKLLYVGYGSALGIIDAATGKTAGDIPLAGHPESFQLEKSGARIFVNVPTARQIAVIDRRERKVTAAWLTALRANYAMALDETHHRLLVGFRQPSKLVVFDTGAGKEAARTDSAGDGDDLFYDAARKRIYLSGGEGYLQVFEQEDADRYRSIAKIATAPGARTSLWVPELNRLYVAVPHRDRQSAEILVYEVR